ncbi:hypothetical protein C3L33_04710, partial [Rhododendron williamsianum]
MKRLLNLGDEKKLKEAIKSIDYLAGTCGQLPSGRRDTVAAALTSFFWLVAQHPEVELAIRAESDRVMGAAMQFDSKFCQEDDTLPDGTNVQKGTRVTYHPYAMGRMEQIWGSDCLEFKPERWLENGVVRPVSPFKYPVFQAGVRVCLGKEMALVEMKSVALALIRRFDIRVAATPSQTPQFVPGLTATVKGGLPVMIHERRL